MTQSDSSRGLWRGQPFYARLTAGGLLAFALVLIVDGVLFVLRGQSGDLAFVVYVGVPTVVIALLALRIGGWALTLAAVWAVLMLLAGLFFLGPVLSQINSFWDFAPAVAAIVARLAAAVGGVGAFVQRRRGTVRQTATLTERRSLVGATAIVVVLVLLSGVLHVASLESVSAEAKAGAVAVRMKDTQFDPTQLTVQAGQAVTLIVKNDDLSVHTFTVHELGINEVVIGGSEKLVAIAASDPGNYEFVCTIPGHEAMKGTLVVQAAAQ